MLTTISLFSGCGGLDLGFAWGGFNITWAIDNDKDACETYLCNFPDVNVVVRDLRRVPSTDIPDADVVIGGFPCQGFSLGGCRRLEDPRNALYREFVRVLADKRPKAFVAENVKGLLTMGRGQVLQQITTEFEAAGYDVQARLYNAKQFGVPQDRERVFLVGIRKDLFVPFKFPEPTHGPGTAHAYATLRETIWSIRGAPGEFLDGSYSPRFLSRQRKRGWGEVGFCVQACAKQNALHPDGERMRKVGNDRWELVGDINRRLSAEECKLIQSFPKEFQVVGSLTSRYKQIGNAVPPLLASAIAGSLRAAILNTNLN